MDDNKEVADLSKTIKKLNGTRNGLVKEINELKEVQQNYKKIEAIHDKKVADLEERHNVALVELEEEFKEKKRLAQKDVDELRGELVGIRELIKIEQGKLDELSSFINKEVAKATEEAQVKVNKERTALQQDKNRVEELIAQYQNSVKENAIIKEQMAEQQERLKQSILKNEAKTKQLNLSTDETTKIKDEVTKKNLELIAGRESLERSEKDLMTRRLALETEKKDLQVKKDNLAHNEKLYAERLNSIMNREKEFEERKKKFAEKEAKINSEMKAIEIKRKDLEYKELRLKKESNKE